MIPTSAATAPFLSSPDGHGWHEAASENREKPLEHSEQNGPSCPSAHPPEPPLALEDPLQLAIEGHGSARSEPLSAVCVDEGANHVLVFWIPPNAQTRLQMEAASEAYYSLTERLSSYLSNSRAVVRHSQRQFLLDRTRTRPGTLYSLFHHRVLYLQSYQSTLCRRHTWCCPPPGSSS